jgi:protein-disulfide isomerase
MTIVGNAGARRHRRGIMAGCATLTALLVLSGCTPASTSPSPTASASTTVQTGTVGAVDFSSGYITLGTGPTVIDSYFDLLCPYCQAFELSNGTQLAELVAAEQVTLRLHPMVFLDSMSQGTQYSTRATNALVGVAAAAPDAVLPFLELLFTHQPAENEEGLTDAQLSALAVQAAEGTESSVDIDSVLSEHTYEAWSIATTAAAASEGGVPSEEISQLTGVPVVLVDGHRYTGNLMDAAAFAAFAAAA